MVGPIESGAMELWSFPQFPKRKLSVTTKAYLMSKYQPDLQACHSFHKTVLYSNAKVRGLSYGHHPVILPKLSMESGNQRRRETSSKTPRIKGSSVKTEIFQNCGQHAGYPSIVIPNKTQPFTCICS